MNVFMLDGVKALTTTVESPHLGLIKICTLGVTAKGAHLNTRSRSHVTNHVKPVCSKSFPSVFDNHYY